MAAHRAERHFYPDYDRLYRHRYEVEDHGHYIGCCKKLAETRRDLEAALIQASSNRKDFMAEKAEAERTKQELARINRKLEHERCLTAALRKQCLDARLTGSVVTEVEHLLETTLYDLRRQAYRLERSGGWKRRGRVECDADDDPVALGGRVCCDGDDDDGDDPVALGGGRVVCDGDEDPVPSGGHENGVECDGTVTGPSGGREGEHENGVECDEAVDEID